MGSRNAYHRTAFELVQRAIADDPADGDFAWARLALRAYVSEALVGIGAVSTAQLTEDAEEQALDSAHASDEPGELMRGVVARQAARLLARYAEQAPNEPVHPWLEFLTASDGFIEESGPNSLIEVLLSEDHDGEQVPPALDAARATAPNWKTDEKAFDRWYAGVVAFVNQPTEEAARAHPMLRLIPDPTALVRQWPMFCLQTRTRGGTMQNEDAYLGWEFQSGGGTFKCIVSVAENYYSQFDLADERLRYYDYQAWLCQRGTTDGQWTAIAKISGVYIQCSSPDGEALSDGDMMWALDTHSALLNDVWKVLQYEYAKRRGYTSFSRLVEEEQPDESGVAVIHAEIAKENRGKGMLPVLLNAFVAAIKREDRVCLACDPLADRRYDPDYCYDEDELDAGGLEVAPPFLLVAPIEGTEPERLTMSPLSVMQVASPHKVRMPAAAKDAAVERRRAKLKAHFERLALEAVDLITYNPWDYPIT